MPLFECVPNISEGCREWVVRALADAVSAVQGVCVLDISTDRSHNRSVLTLAGDAGGLSDAVVTLVERAVALIDLRTHVGEHPRIGAVDVIPFVPLGGATMAACTALALDTAKRVGERCGVPVFLYEEAATVPARRNLADVRRGGFEALEDRMAGPDWSPDFGPSGPHSTAGATAIGAREVLIAFNVNLASDRLEVAQAVASAVRESSGGLPYVKALAINIATRGIVQVSMNLTNYKSTSMAEAFLAVEREAASHGVAVLDSEVVGLVPTAALPVAGAAHLRLRDFTSNSVLETRLAACGWGQALP